MRVISIFVFLFFSLGLDAQQIYVCTQNADLWLIDIGTCSSTLVGNTVSTLSDIALSPSGILYGIDANTLYTISSSNASLTPVAGVSLIPNYAVALVCDQNGDLYAGGNDLMKLDWSTGNWTILGSFAPYQAGGDLTFYNGDLYLADVGQVLVQVGITPFSLTSMGTMVSMTNIFGVITSGHPIYDPCTGAIIGGDSTRIYATGGNQIFLVDPSNANVTLTCTIPIQAGDVFFGAASAEESQSAPIPPAPPETPVPNVFSPNGDGINDFFIPATVGGSPCGTDGSFEVYNRWGQLIYEGAIFQSWDGKNKSGNECAEGVYYFILHRHTPTIAEVTTTGYVSLFR